MRSASCAKRSQQCPTVSTSSRTGSTAWAIRPSRCASRSPSPSAANPSKSTGRGRRTSSRRRSTARCPPRTRWPTWRFAAPRGLRFPIAKGSFVPSRSPRRSAVWSTPRSRPPAPRAASSPTACWMRCSGPWPRSPRSVFPPPAREGRPPPSSPARTTAGDTSPEAGCWAAGAGATTWTDSTASRTPGRT